MTKELLKLLPAKQLSQCGFGSFAVIIWYCTKGDNVSDFLQDLSYWVVRFAFFAKMNDLRLGL